MICSNCNKEIEDGAVFCPFCGGKQETQSAKSGGLMGDLTEVLKGVFSNPKDMLKNTYKKSNIILALILIGVQSVISGFMAMGLLKGAGKSILEDFFRYMDVPYVKIFFIGFLGAAGIDALMALFLFVFLGVVSKKEVTFQSALCAVGMKALANTPFLLLACLSGLIKFWIGFIFAISGMILGYIFMYTAVPDDTKETVIPVYGKYLSSLCGVLSSFLWLYILLKMFF